MTKAYLRFKTTFNNGKSIDIVNIITILNLYSYTWNFKLISVRVKIYKTLEISCDFTLFQL